MAVTRSILRAVRGSAAQVANYIGLSGEIVWNTERLRPHFQDGATPGGVPISTIGDLTNSSGVISLVVQGTQDGNPTLDQWSAIQNAWNLAVTLGLPLQLTPGPNVQGVLDVRISRALRQYANNARLRTDGRVRLHGYWTDFVSTTGGIGSPAAIDTGTMIYIGPDPSLPASARISGCELERITCVFHPPVDNSGARVPSLVTSNLVYINRVDRPRVRIFDGSGLNAGNGFAYASCTDIDFASIIVHDCAMVVDPTATDNANKNAQISGVNADDNWYGLGINPTIGGSINGILVYGLSSNRAQRQVDGVTDQGTRSVVWNGMIVNGCDEGLDTWATGSTYLGLEFTNCTNPLKVGHGARNNRIEGRSQGGTSSAGDGRACVLLFAGNRNDTANNRIVWQAVNWSGTRFLEMPGDNSNAVISRTGTIGTTRITGSEIILTIRQSAAARLMTDGGTGTGNVVRFDIDDASVDSTLANPAGDFFQMSNNLLTRITLKWGQRMRPVAPNEARARAMGATPYSGYIDQANGVLRDVVGAVAVAPTYSSGPLTVAVTSSQTRYWAAAYRNAGSGAGTEIGISLSPNENGPGVRDVQIVAIQTGGGVADCIFRTPNGDLPVDSLRLMAGGQAWLPGLDNATNIGSASKRMSQIFAGTGTISTSDAREKTPVRPLSEAEIAWAQDIAHEVGAFRFLTAVAEKGEDEARLHVGTTVQRVIELGRSRGLDPLRYAFICYDAWPETPAVPEIREDVRGEDGEPTGETRVVQKAEPARPAGELYGFRADQLALFIGRGLDARLAALEAGALSAA